MITGIIHDKNVLQSDSYSIADGRYSLSVVTHARCNGRCGCGTFFSLPARLEKTTQPRDNGKVLTVREAWIVDGNEDARFVPASSGNGFIVNCGCGMQMRVKPVTGILKVEHECGAKCRTSKGYKCECSCAGENHGCDAR